MSLIEKQFYNIFWQDKSCQNLFLLSKEELLETSTFESDNYKHSYSLNRIIISNVEKKDLNFDTIKYRSENYDLALGNSLEKKVEYFKPIFEDFFDKNFKKAFEKLTDDIEKNGWKFLMKIIKLFSNENKIEERVIKELQFYGFIGKHLNSFEDLENNFKNKFLPSKEKELLNEHTIDTFLQTIKYIKEIYVNQSYKKLYSTNQILVNTLNSEDSFESRLVLFHHLYESKIISACDDDAFVECSHCEPGTYKGVFQLRINPKKLSNLKCPICANNLTYFVPYRLHEDIYKIIKDKDGLILNALCNKLSQHNIKYKTNQNFSNDLEIDCLFTIEKQCYVVETKMYKINTEINKIKSKVKSHYGKLVDDVKRLSVLDEFKDLEIKPLLLLNINDDLLLRRIVSELKVQNNGILEMNTSIVNLDLLKFEN